MKPENWDICEEVVKLIPSRLAVKYRVVPLSVREGILVLGVDVDFDGESKEALEFILSKSIITELKEKSSLTKALDYYYGERRRELSEDEFSFDKESVSSEGEVLEIIREGIERGASDIHWETGSQGRELVIRYRIDGELRGGRVLVCKPAKIISHIKLLSHMSIDQKRLPQDGRLGWSYGGKKYDLRVSSISTIHGENLVMRILDREDMNLDLKGLGLLEEDGLRLQGLLGRSDGLLLVTGPTGSGKTTTLYASLKFRGQFDDKIITVEDPVEYEFSDFSQITVSGNAGITFAGALRAVLRQSPDTIMIGEIRDKETAQIAVNAALTGHLVVTTLHANDSLSAVYRLLDLGVEPYQISASLRGVVAQRLVRRLCSFCKQRDGLSDEEKSLLDLDDGEGGCMCFRSKGCEHCQNTGFKGRLGLFEVLPMEKVLTGLIYDRANPEALREQVRLLGIRTLKRCGIEKIFEGLTTVEEVVAEIMLN